MAQSAGASTYQYWDVPLYKYTSGALHLFDRRWELLRPTSRGADPKHNPRRSLRLITYNVWFEALYKEHRAEELLRLLCEQNPDVCCLQEVTPAFEHVLRSIAFARKNWVVTSLEDQLSKTHSVYGTLILVNKSLLRDGWTPLACFVNFPESRSARGLLLLRLSSSNDASGQILIGNVHLDYEPAIRNSELNLCRTLLEASLSPAAAILCGDMNIRSYAEVASLLHSGYVDAFAATRQKSISPEADLLLQGTTMQSGIRRPGSLAKDRSRRVDIVMCRRFRVDRYYVVGDRPIARDKLQGTRADEDPLLQVFPSDHMGVCVDVVLK